MIMKRIFAIVIVVLTITSLLTFSETSEGTDNLDGKTKESAIQKEIILDVDETKTLHFNSNVRTFEFEKLGDGYSYTIEQTTEVGKVEYILNSLSGPSFTNTWPSNGKAIFHADGVDITLTKVGIQDSISLTVKLTEPHSCNFYIKFSVISCGLIQEVYYKIHLSYHPPISYTYEFRDVTMDYEGNFTTQGAMYQGETLIDKSHFKFYAVGLYPGISIHNDLFRL